jgi:hypothetical protein
VLDPVLFAAGVDGNARVAELLETPSDGLAARAGASAVHDDLGPWVGQQDGSESVDVASRHVDGPGEVSVGVEAGSQGLDEHGWVGAVEP